MIKSWYFVFLISIFILMGGITSAQESNENNKADLTIKEFEVSRDDNFDKFYIEILIENKGTAPVDKLFYVTIFLDGNVYAREFVDSEIAQYSYAVEHYEYPSVVGTHELKVKIDSYSFIPGEVETETYQIENLDNLIDESNENNNEFSGSFKLNSEYQNAQWECNDGYKQTKSADCWEKDVFKRQAEKSCQNRGGLYSFEVSTECEYIAAVCGDNICSKGEGNNCEQIGQQCKTGENCAGQQETSFCYIKCPLDCGVGFTNAQWECNDGEEHIEEDEDNCNSYETWRGMAIGACSNQCNEGGQCGLVISSIRLSEECGEPFWTKISNWFLSLIGIESPDEVIYEETIIEPEPIQDECVRCPDLNYDGEVNSRDASLLYNCASTGSCSENYDLNGDGITSIVSDVNCFTTHQSEKTWKINSCLDSTANKKIVNPAVVLINFEGNAQYPNENKFYWSNKIFEPKDNFSFYNWFGEVSYGRYIIEGNIDDVYGWYSVAQPHYETTPRGTRCDIIELFNNLIPEIDPSINFSEYDYVLLRFGSPCNYDLFSREVMTNEGNVTFIVPAFKLIPGEYFSIHEWLHMFDVKNGLTIGEGQTLECGNVSIRTNLNECSKILHGDQADIMGTVNGERGHLNGVYKKKMGWIANSETIEVQNSGVYEVTPLELPRGIKLLEIPSSQGFVYYVEYRRFVGTDAEHKDYQFRNTTVHYNFSGAMVHKSVSDEVWEYGWARPTSYLIDFSPHDAVNDLDYADSADSVLKVGEIFKDPYDNITITTLEVTENYLKVQIGFDN